MFGVGASFTPTNYGIRFPTKDKMFIHNTVDATDVDKAIPAEHALARRCEARARHAASKR